MARTTISISDDLKARMDAVHGINWSKVASQAFELELAAKAKTNGSLSAALQRLKASKYKSELPGAQGYKERGRMWALETGGYEALLSLGEIDLEKLGDDEHDRRALFNSIMTSLDEDLTGQEGVDAVREIVTEDGERDPSLNQMKWWLSGVQEIWSQVRDEL